MIAMNYRSLIVLYNSYLIRKYNRGMERSPQHTNAGVQTRMRRRKVNIKGKGINEKPKMQVTEQVRDRMRTGRKMIKAGTQRKRRERGWRARTGVKGVTHSCPHHQRPVLIYPEQSIRSGGRH